MSSRHPRLRWPTVLMVSPSLKARIRSPAGAMSKNQFSYFVSLGIFGTVRFDYDNTSGLVTYYLLWATHVLSYFFLKHILKNSCTTRI